MLEEKIRDVFADMVVLKNPERAEFFKNLSLPSYMRDWLVMKFSDEDGEKNTYLITNKDGQYTIQRYQETRVMDTYAAPSKKHPVTTDANGCVEVEAFKGEYKLGADGKEAAAKLTDNEKLSVTLGS